MILWHDKKGKKLRNGKPLYTKGDYDQELLPVNKRFIYGLKLALFRFHKR